MNLRLRSFYAPASTLGRALIGCLAEVWSAGRKLGVLGAIFLLTTALSAQQQFVIVSQRPLTRYEFPGVGTQWVSGVCVVTPVVPARYQAQVSTDMVHWETHLGVTENNAGTNCWIVPIYDNQTNHFFIRAVRLP